MVKLANIETYTENDGMGIFKRILKDNRDTLKHK
jgi:hypothetical protein